MVVFLYTKKARTYTPSLSLYSAILQEKIKKSFLTKEQILFGIDKYKKFDLNTPKWKQRSIEF